MDIKHYQKKKRTLKNIFFFPYLHLCLLKNPKAFTISDQLLAFLINLVCTLPVHPVPLKHLAVVLIHKEMSLKEFNWFVFFDKLGIAFCISLGCSFCFSCNV